jgi:hypothetical protein
MALHYGQPRTISHDSQFRKKSDDFSRRKCPICNRHILPIEKGEIIKLKGKNVLVHKKCKDKCLDSRIPKE